MAVHPAHNTHAQSKRGRPQHQPALTKAGKDKNNYKVTRKRQVNNQETKRNKRGGRLSPAPAPPPPPPPCPSRAAPRRAAHTPTTPPPPESPPSQALPPRLADGRGAPKTHPPRPHAPAKALPSGARGGPRRVGHHRVEGVESNISRRKRVHEVSRTSIVVELCQAPVQCDQPRPPALNSWHPSSDP